jgi:hypothetical protein
MIFNMAALSHCVGSAEHMTVGKAVDWDCHVLKDSINSPRCPTEMWPIRLDAFPKWLQCNLYESR